MISQRDIKFVLFFKYISNHHEKARLVQLKWTKPQKHVFFYDIYIYFYPKNVKKKFFFKYYTHKRFYTLYYLGSFLNKTKPHSSVILFVDVLTSQHIFPHVKPRGDSLFQLTYKNTMKNIELIFHSDLCLLCRGYM